ALIRQYPFQTPRASLLRRLPDVPATGSFTARGGVRYTAYPPGGDHVVKSLYWFGDFDPWVGRTLARLVSPGEIVCDVGASIGDTALPLAAHVGPTGHVYAFEPFPAARECLMANIRANGCANVTVIEHALSDASGEVGLDIPIDQPGM